MAERVATVGVTKEQGYLYFVDKDGDISRTIMSRGKKNGSSRKEKVMRVGVQRKQGYLYYVDKKGDVSCAPLQRGR
jgi:uncharacterized protein YcgL (UPF0745 family)